MTTLTLTLPFIERPFCGDDVLVFYDGPLVFWLPCQSQDATRLLCIALPREVGRGPFLVVTMTHRAAAALENNELTLQGAALGPGPKYLMADYDALLLVLQPLDTVPGHWLPGAVMLNYRPAT